MEQMVDQRNREIHHRLHQRQRNQKRYQTNRKCHDVTAPLRRLPPNATANASGALGRLNSVCIAALPRYSDRELVRIDWVRLD